ncbi:ComEC family competence protein [Thalassospira sp. HF15]|uniref:ComEC/Rec2 family competence protein n=1 Tax=Thalassospira sp. HF15 TaxID=2722755 RepID=UPI001431935E|nr:ComEC/Rec2 family competence protein [Thalassospira sp. HF15]NIY74207.1 ComEC family competence protein [Thalassospira sp. HF15]
MFFSQINFVVTSQRNKWFLCSVIFFGLGCAGYFLLPARVDLTQIGVAVILLCCGFWMSRRLAILAFVFQLLACLAFGTLASAIHTELGPRNLLTKTLYSTEVTGTIISLEPRNGRIRATLKPSEIVGIPNEQLDWSIRLSFLGDSDLAIGDEVKASARVFPLRPPSVPGDPDFARNLYFSNIGASGFVFGRQFEVRKSENSLNNNVLLVGVEKARQSISTTISDSMTGPETGIAKALIIGERGEVTANVADNLRKSGLAHLLAISGLHMGLLCGTVFFLMRFGLAAVPQIALRNPIKKWAAMAAMLAGLVYLGLSGATIPTQRAFVMLLVVWVALLLDRRAISLRLVGVAAIVVLILRPDAVLGASFQLSFAAVGALVAFYDGPGRRWLDRQGMLSWYERIGLYLGGLLLTSLIVTAVTAPIIGYHFGRISMLGILANLVAIPVMAFWVMPWIVLTLALIPFGLAGVSLAAMKPGLTVLLQTAELVAAQDWGLWYVSGLDMLAVTLSMLALAWMIIWRDKWMILPMVPVLIAVITFQAMHQEPEILISGDRESWAIYDPDAGILHTSSRLNDFQKDIWMNRFGIRPEQEQSRVHACGDDPCRIDVSANNFPSRIIVASRITNPFYACRNADIIVNQQTDLPNTCQAARARTVIDDDVLWWQGGVAVKLPASAANPPKIKTVRDDSGNWPWIIIGGRAGR